MKRCTPACLAVLAAAMPACGAGGAPPPRAGEAEAAAAAETAPVSLNPDVPIQYPPRLYDRGVEGDVVLRLFVDSTGRLVAESSRVAKSSGHPALDSAALAGSRQLRFAPAHRRGAPVSAAFLQPIEFRRDASAH